MTTSLEKPVHSLSIVRVALARGSVQIHAVSCLDSGIIPRYIRLRELASILMYEIQRVSFRGFACRNLTGVERKSKRIALLLSSNLCFPFGLHLLVDCIVGCPSPCPGPPISSLLHPSSQFISRSTNEPISSSTDVDERNLSGRKYAQQNYPWHGPHSKTVRGMARTANLSVAWPYEDPSGCRR